MAIGTGASCAAVFARFEMYGNPAYLITLGVIWMIAGDFSSVAASVVAVRLSRFWTLKALMA